MVMVMMACRFGACRRLDPPAVRSNFQGQIVDTTTIRSGSTEPAPLAPDARDEPVEGRRTGHGFAFHGHRSAPVAPVGAAADANIFLVILMARWARAAAAAHLGPSQFVQFAQSLLLLPPPLGAQQIAEHVQEEDDGHRVQEGEETLISKSTISIFSFN